MILAIKYNEDDYYSNEYYAKVGGVNQSEFNELEYNFLVLLNFETYINYKVYENYETQLINFDKK